MVLIVSYAPLICWHVSCIDMSTDLISLQMVGSNDQTKGKNHGKNHVGNKATAIDRDGREA